MFCTYIIESEKNGMWYYGYSENIERRLIGHNTGKNKSTKHKGPWKIIFKRDFDSKLLAARFELELKGLKSKEYVRRAFKEFFLGV
jgi:putative endonuclease